MGFFDFLGGENPADKAMPYLEQIPETITPYYQPYINTGKKAMGQAYGNYQQGAGLQPDLMNLYGGMVNNPGDFYSKMGQGFQQSPGYDFALQQALGAINNSAAAGGMAGTQQHQMQAGTMASNLANQEFYNYLSNIMKMFGMGVEGQQGLYNTGMQGLNDFTRLGYGASDALAQGLSQNLQNQAGLEYAGQANQNQTRGGLIGNAAALGAGFAFGPPGYGAVKGVQKAGGYGGAGRYI